MKDIASRMLEVKQEVAQFCAQDSDFREAFLANPAAAIEEKYELVEGSLSEMTFKPVIEEQGEVVIVVGPDLSEASLSDEQLDQVAGGFAFTVITTATVAGAVFGGVNATVAVGGAVNDHNKEKGNGNW